ncbi:MAG: F0F1 ATP synthase subunit epsilon [Alphaproteobacteria bacterium]|nr:F0F1 ATP synthase subunit epsilon [Alphaproteobacteria bacterium]MDE1987087.1 F0F1 ATP synthase subunit epsilon [Alphaproteobacteria bacterium]MDE2163920.1 F0F1 ATP synthase subunit epsilon [Alphaproteobacteria bacterium]MDE2264749.1 F0F1 ATP synthase subunit epsilon [Alphaproteobacteria bacterium]MDE2500730.1 F0F1 ATP synthase subunit epsilon [Alphaproteobacteria bacterium]
MTDKIAFDLVSPERLLLSEEAEMVTVPGTEGDMGVMAGHMPLISTLRQGVIDVKGGTNGDERFYVIGGFVEISPNKLTVLAEEAVPVAELDAAALDQRIKSAEEDLSLAKSDSERAKAQETLDYVRGLRSAL